MLATHSRADPRLLQTYEMTGPQGGVPNVGTFAVPLPMSNVVDSESNSDETDGVTRDVRLQPSPPTLPKSSSPPAPLAIPLSRSSPRPNKQETRSLPASQTGKSGSRGRSCSRMRPSRMRPGWNRLSFPVRSQTLLRFLAPDSREMHEYC